MMAITTGGSGDMETVLKVVALVSDPEAAKARLKEIQSAVAAANVTLTQLAKKEADIAKQVEAAEGKITAAHDEAAKLVDAAVGAATSARADAKTAATSLLDVERREAEVGEREVAAVARERALEAFEQEAAALKVTAEEATRDAAELSAECKAKLAQLDAIARA